MGCCFPSGKGSREPTHRPGTADSGQTGWCSAASWLRAGIAHRCARYEPLESLLIHLVLDCLLLHYDAEKACRSRVPGKYRVKRAGLPRACLARGCLSGGCRVALCVCRVALCVRGQERAVPEQGPGVAGLEAGQRVAPGTSGLDTGVAWRPAVRRVVKVQALTTQSSCKFSLWTSSAHFTWEHVRNAEFRPHPTSAGSEFAF